jgi:hypothetical protein
MTWAAKLIVGAASTTVALLLLPVPAAVATGCALVLLGVLPGAALARILGPVDLVLAMLVTFTGSVAVTIGVSTVLLYLRLWSGSAAAVGVGVLTVLLVLWSERGAARDLA